MPIPLVGNSLLTNRGMLGGGRQALRNAGLHPGQRMSLICRDGLFIFEVAGFLADAQSDNRDVLFVGDEFLFLIDALDVTVSPVIPNLRRCRMTVLTDRCTHEQIRNWLDRVESVINPNAVYKIDSGSMVFIGESSDSERPLSAINVIGLNNQYILDDLSDWRATWESFVDASSQMEKDEHAFLESERCICQQLNEIGHHQNQLPESLRRLEEASETDQHLFRLEQTVLGASGGVSDLQSSLNNFSSSFKQLANSAASLRVDGERVEKTEFLTRVASHFNSNPDVVNNSTANAVIENRIRTLAEKLTRILDEIEDERAKASVLLTKYRQMAKPATSDHLTSETEQMKAYSSKLSNAKNDLEEIHTTLQKQLRDCCAAGRESEELTRKLSIPARLTQLSQKVATWPETGFAPCDELLKKIGVELSSVCAKQDSMQTVETHICAAQALAGKLQNALSSAIEDLNRVEL